MKLIKNTIRLTIFLLFISKIHAQQNSLFEKTELWDNGKVKCSGKHDKSFKQGIWQCFDSLGLLIEEVKYVNGNKYFWNKWESGIQVIENGEGYLKEYYNNSSLKALGQIKEGKKFGKWIEYYTNGKTQNIIEFTDWPANFRSHIKYKQKLIESYDSIGTIICHNGSGYIFITNFNGEITRKEFFFNNKKDSVYTFHSNGNLNEFRVVQNINNIETTKRSYHYSGKKSYEEVLVNDSLIRTTWYLNGEIMSINKQTNNFEITTLYYENGLKEKERKCSKTLSFDDILEESELVVCSEKNWTINGELLDE